MFFEETDLRENLERKIRRDSGSIIVAVDNESVIGNVFLVEDGWMAWIFRLAVREEYRKKGIGSLLMNEAEKRIRDRGLKPVGLFVEEENQKLKEWYEKRGYTKGGAYRFLGQKYNDKSRN